MNTMSFSELYILRGIASNIDALVLKDFLISLSNKKKDIKVQTEYKLKVQRDNLEDQLDIDDSTDTDDEDVQEDPKNVIPGSGKGRLWYSLSDSELDFKLEREIKRTNHSASQPAFQFMYSCKSISDSLTNSSADSKE